MGRGSVGARGGQGRSEAGGVSDREVPLKTLLRWSEALSAIARTGLAFTESLYEQERFEEILRVAADIRPRPTGDRPAPTTPSGLVQEWLDRWARASPATSPPRWPWARRSGNDQGEMLLVQRADSGVWLYPTGWSDVGYSAAEVVVKEVEEETGIDVEPVRLIAVLDGLRLGFTAGPAVLARLPLPGRRRRASSRTRSRRATWAGSPATTCPSPWSGSERWGEHVFAAINGEHRDVLYDRVRQPMWRGEATTS